MIVFFFKNIPTPYIGSVKAEKDKIVSGQTRRLTIMMFGVKRG